MSYLVYCRFNMISTDNVVTYFNDIISSYRRIRNTWHNPVANTGRLYLLKSIKTISHIGIDGNKR